LIAGFERRPANRPEGREAAIQENIISSFREEMARVTGLEPATSGVTGRHSNQLSYTRAVLSKRRMRRS
jgi:hypothetical protein